MAIIFAIFGIITNNIIFASHFPSILEVRKTKELKNIQPFLFPTMIATSLALMIYAISSSYHLVLFYANFMGVLFGIYYTLTCFPYLDEKTREMTTIFCVLFPLIFSTEVLVYNLQQDSYDEDERFTPFGVITVLFVILYYVVPSYKLVYDIVILNSPRVDLFYSILHLFNSIMWCIYGIGINDPCIWMGYMVGILYGLAAIMSKFAQSFFAESFIEEHFKNFGKNSIGKDYGKTQINEEDEPML
eukprot:TRINITY_DN1088_c0_g1_i4.p1 TRINITY_DN1088_c0_g1~~TRINITY_DN1088_c0_g1_i4.p1  ORF type:complete len:255 (+),score=10.34 TRINITY_DN1088_c0_g1_i4:32-766(+)